MSDAQSPTDTEPAPDGDGDSIHQTVDELAAEIHAQDPDRDRARQLVRELADDLGAFDSDALWSELDGLREVREGIEPAPEKDVGDLNASGIIRTSDLAGNLSILQILMGSGFKDNSSVRFGVLTLRPKRGDTWSVEASGEVLEYVNAAAYETATDLYADLWRLDRLARRFDSEWLLFSMG